MKQAACVNEGRLPAGDSMGSKRMGSWAPFEVTAWQPCWEGRMAQALRNEGVEKGRQRKVLGALRAFDRGQGRLLPAGTLAVGHEARPEVSYIKRGRRALEAGGTAGAGAWRWGSPSMPAEHRGV